MDKAKPLTLHITSALIHVVACVSGLGTRASLFIHSNKFNELTHPNFPATLFELPIKHPNAADQAHSPSHMAHLQWSSGLPQLSRAYTPSIDDQAALFKHSECIRLSRRGQTDVRTSIQEEVVAVLDWIMYVFARLLLLNFVSDASFVQPSLEV